jgi:hypothetical protein
MGAWERGNTGTRYCTGHGRYTRHHTAIVGWRLAQRGSAVAWGWNSGGSEQGVKREV